MMECLATLDVGSKSRESVTQMIEKLNKMDEHDTASLQKSHHKPRTRHVDHVHTHTLT